MCASFLIYNFIIIISDLKDLKDFCRNIYTNKRKMFVCVPVRDEATARRGIIIW